MIDGMALYMSANQIIHDVFIFILNFNGENFVVK